MLADGFTSRGPGGAVRSKPSGAGGVTTTTLTILSGYF